MIERPIIIGVAGGTGSGKTTVAMEILERVGTEHVAYIPHDAYYHDLQELPPAERARINYDHPDSLESELLIEHLDRLKAGQAVEVPIYNFTRHVRTDETRRVGPAPVVLVEGILVFAEPALREAFDVKLYVDTDADIRILRRLQRDVQERGRSLESVIRQYLTTVRPMHLEFVEPSKRYADVIIPEGGFNEVAIEMVAARIRGLLEQTREEKV
jgi:uridine kinase